MKVKRASAKAIRKKTYHPKRNYRRVWIKGHWRKIYLHKKRE